MIILLGHILAGFVELLQRSGSDYENPVVKQKEELIIKQELKEEAENELRQKRNLFLGYNTFITEQINEFSQRLQDTGVDDPTKSVAADIDLFEHSIDELKELIDYSEPARSKPPTMTSSGDMKHRIASLRHFSEEVMGKVASIKSQVRAVGSEFSPLQNKWNAIKSEFHVDLTQQ